MTGQLLARFEAVARFAEALSTGPLPDLGEPPLHPRTARALAQAFASGWSRRRLARLSAQLQPGSEPVGTVAVIAPGNLFVAAWQAVLEPWLAGNHVRVRPSARDGGAVAWLIDRLRAAGADGLPEVVSLVAGDPRGWREFFAAQTLAIWGGDDSLAAVQALATAHGFGGQVRCHGHRLAVAVIEVPRLGRAQLRAAMAGLARDVLHGDGRGCLSLGSVVFLGVGAGDLLELHRELAQALGRQGSRWPCGVDRNAPIVQHINIIHDYLQLAGAVRPFVALTAGHEGWVASGPPDLLGGAWPGPAHRCVTATAAELSTLPSVLAPFRGRTSGLATVAGPASRAALRRLLDCTFVCAPGALQCPPCDRATDGFSTFETYRRPTG